LGDGGWARKGIDPELDLTRIEPFPQLVIDLTDFEVILEGPVVPSPDAGRASIVCADFVLDASNANAGIDAQPPEVDLEKHGSSLKGFARVVESSDQRGIREVIAFG
jgi:hypothetical protein